MKSLLKYVILVFGLSQIDSLTNKVFLQQNAVDTLGLNDLIASGNNSSSTTPLKITIVNGPSSGSNTNQASTAIQNSNTPAAQPIKANSVPNGKTQNTLIDGSATSRSTNITPQSKSLIGINSGSNNSTNSSLNTLSPSSISLNYFYPPVSKSGSSWWWWNIIPSRYWVDFNGQSGRSFIALKSQAGNYVACDYQGSTSARSSDLRAGHFWIPVHISGNMIALRNYYGGYLAANSDGSTNCLSREVLESNRFNVILASDPHSVDNSKPAFLMLKGMDGYIVGADSNYNVSCSFQVNNNFDQLFGSALTDDQVPTDEDFYGTSDGETIVPR